MTSGISVLIGPTGGYLWSFLPAVMIIGYISEKNITSKHIPSFLSCILVTLFMLITGTLYLSIFLGLDKALLMGFYPFIIVGFIKSFISASIITFFKKLS